MPRLPRCSAREVVRVLEHLGFARVRVRGSHWIFRHRDTKRRVVVPHHGPRIIPPGTMANIVRETGVSLDEFERLLRTV
ncbi:MAG: type II toxin-antitoxin system HicA family toxin [Chloroflexi bacterium]|nr:type II toxin-antitoxin system HicA family toxin [Chloroflexota bacterium]